MIDQTSTQRTKANLITMIVLFVIGAIGIFLVVQSISIIADEAASPAGSGKGLANIFVSISMLALVFATSITLFFGVILALNLKLPRSVDLLPDVELKSYSIKATMVGLGGVLLGAVLVLIVIFSDWLDVGDLYSLFVGISAVALIPVTILIFIWSFIYLFRSHKVQAMIEARHINRS